MHMLSSMKVEQVELAQLREMFEQCDTSKDGFLTAEELRVGLEGVLGAL